MHRDTLSKGKMWLCSQHPPAEHNAKTCMWYHTATYTIYHYRMHYAHIFFCLQWRLNESVHRSDLEYMVRGIIKTFNETFEFGGLCDLNMTAVIDLNTLFKCQRIFSEMFGFFFNFLGMKSIPLFACQTITI